MVHTQARTAARPNDVEFAKPQKHVDAGHCCDVRMRFRERQIPITACLDLVPQWSFNARSRLHTLTALCAFVVPVVAARVAVLYLGVAGVCLRVVVHPLFDDGYVRRMLDFIRVLSLLHFKIPAPALAAILLVFLDLLYLLIANAEVVC